MPIQTTDILETQCTPQSEGVENNDLVVLDPHPLREFLQHFVRNRSAMIGLAILFLFFLLALLAPLLTPYTPFEQDSSALKLRPFSPGHFWGTDDLGRDLFTRVAYGGRISLSIGFFSTSIALFFGGLFGLVAGFLGGWLDRLLMRLADILLSFPYILLAIIIVTVLGPSLVNAMIAISISSMPIYARLMRSSVLSVKEEEYVLAERSLGASTASLMFVTVLPNSITPMIVQATLGIGNAILSSAALSFIGLGAQPPNPEWGLMIASSRQFVTTASWIVLFPGLATMLAVFGFNLLGDGIRDLLDPRLKK